LPDGRLHLISAVTPQKTVVSSASPSVSQTLPASTSTPQRTLLIGGQRFILSSTPGAQVLLNHGNVTGQKLIPGATMSRPSSLMLASPSQPTIIRMPSGQHVMLRSSQPGTVITTPQSSTASSVSQTQGGLLSATVKSSPSTPYAVTPEVVQQGNWCCVLSAFLFVFI